MSYTVYKEKETKAYRYQQLIGYLRIHPFYIWLFGIEAGMMITALWVLWLL